MNYKQEHKDRYLILKGLYDCGASGDSAGVHPSDIGVPLALSPEESVHAAAQLQRAGLVECTQASAVRLTEEGLRTIERVLRHPLPATDHYPDVVDYTDSEKGTRSVEDVESFLAYLEQVLPKLDLDAQERALIGKEIEALEAELDRPCPLRSATLERLATIRAVLTRAAKGDGIGLTAEATRLLDTGVIPSFRNSPTQRA